EDESRVVPYSGVLERAFLDVAAWVEDGRAPAPSTSYTVTDDAQIGVDSDASERGGIQPSVELTVSGADRIDVEVGQPVT
ncbi:Tat pathway signal sequence domain protein, partial [Pseudomonas sp. BGM005]|nr:Tat pathway signal sequence domain protein [Pseudomonas sp. BG5]